MAHLINGNCKLFLKTKECNDYYCFNNSLVMRPIPDVFCLRADGISSFVCWPNLYASRFADITVYGAVVRAVIAVCVGHRCISKVLI